VVVGKDLQRTIKHRIPTSHDALIIYIFHPMLASPIGIMNVKMSLQKKLLSPQRREKVDGYAHAKTFNTSDEKAIPLARIE
jgi:hypothetical protein